MKYKHIIVLFLIGCIFWLIGALIRLMHWPFGHEILTFSTFIQIISIVILIVKLLKNNDINSKLNQ
jgi:hypothetical protein